VHVNTGYRVGELGNAGRQKSAASADLEYRVRFGDLQRLQYSSLQGRCHHALAVTYRYLCVSKRQRLKTGRYKLLARGLDQQLKDICVQNIPCPHLLLDHLPPGEIGIHRCFTLGCRKNNKIIELFECVEQSVLNIVRFRLPNYGESRQPVEAAAICCSMLRQGMLHDR
jgi:hypothetical protein